MRTACRRGAGQWFKAVVTLAWVHREGPTEQGPPKPCFHAPRRPLPLPKVLVPQRGHRCPRTHPSVARPSPAPVHLHVADSSSQGERGTPPPSLAHSMALARRLLVTGDPHAAARCRWVLPAAASQPPVESSPLPLPRTPGGTRATACTRCVWPGTRHPQVLRRPAVSHGHQNDTSRDARCEWQRRIHPPRPGASPLGGTVLPGPASYLRSASCRLHLCYRVLCWHRWDSSR